MTKPCQIGFKCPHFAVSEWCDPICIYPYTADDDTMEEEFGCVDELDCPLLEYPSLLYDLLDLSDAI